VASLATMRFSAPSEEQIAHDLAAIREHGFVVIEGLLSERDLAEIRRDLTLHLASDPCGRNNFEGHRTQRVYSLVGKGRIFADLAEHPRIMALCDALLASNYLLTASQAICIHPGETPQPFHTDDSFYPIPRPRRAVSVSTIWAVDPFTAENGATQVVPRSHLWSDEQVGALLVKSDFETAAREERTPKPAPPLRAEWKEQIQDVVMPAGAAIFFLGMLVHRGGENQSGRPRLAFSNQYCEPWARQQENFFLSIPGDKVAAMSDRVQQLLGYSIHPPFMGHVNGVHPKKVLRPTEN
jgi:ectoine hydroxylase-related dioxygenase (phytanoyl-CoA dioxygenase family)